MKKRFLSVLLATTMIASMFAGCGKKPVENTSTPNVTKNEETTKTDDKKDVTKEEVTETKGFTQTWPDGYKIRWFVRGDKTASTYSRYHELKGIEKIEEMFNVDIEFVVASGDNIDEQYLLMLSSGDLPEVISYLHTEAYAGGIPALHNEGVSIELNDLIDNNMPNLKKIFTDYPEVSKDMKTNDGKYLYFQRINALDTEYDKVVAGDTGLVMRQDWLDNVGLDVPTTMDEWYNVLSAFKSMDPNGNGLADEIPYDASSAGINLFYGAYKINTGAYVNVDTGKVSYGEITQEYKEFLTELNKWYKEGIISNIFDESGAWVNSKVGDENIVGHIAGSWKGLANAWGKWLPGLKEKNPDSALVAVPYPVAKDGKTHIPNAKFSRVQREAQIISVDCEFPEAVAAVMDYMYSEEGSELLVWGEENVTFTKGMNNERVITEFGNAQIELPDGGKPQNYKMYGNAGTSFPYFGMNDINVETREAEYIEACKVWTTGEFGINYPKAISLSAEELEKVAVSNTDINAYIVEMRWKFITGQEPLSNYDSYVANLERMGINDIIEVYQNAYDLYLAR